MGDSAISVLRRRRSPRCSTGSWRSLSNTDRDTDLCRSKPRSFITRGFATITSPVGTRFLTDFGIDLFAAGTKRRRFFRSCLDWTERRQHIGGAVGVALANRCFDLGWTERMKHSRAVIVTASGRRGLLEAFGITVSEENGVRPG